MTHNSQCSSSRAGTTLSIRESSREELTLTFKWAYCSLFLVSSLTGLMVSSLSDTSDMDDMPL